MLIGKRIELNSSAKLLISGSISQNCGTGYGVAELKQGFQSLETLAVSGSPTWARTRDTRINSPLLYRLSYRGIGEGVILKILDDLVNAILRKKRMNVSLAVSMDALFLKNQIVSAVAILSSALVRFCMEVANEMRKYPSAPNAEPGTTATPTFSSRYSDKAISVASGILPA